MLSQVHHPAVEQIIRLLHRALLSTAYVTRSQADQATANAAAQLALKVGVLASNDTLYGQGLNGVAYGVTGLLYGDKGQFVAEHVPTDDRARPVRAHDEVGPQLTPVTTADDHLGTGVVDRDGLGGAAVLTDVVPSKTLIAAAEILTRAVEGARRVEVLEIELLQELRRGLN